MLIEEKFKILKKYLNFIVFDTDDVYEKSAYCNILNILNILDNITNEEDLVKIETKLLQKQRYY